MTRHLIICGSPRSHGKCARLARKLAERCRAEAPDARIDTYFVSDGAVAPCEGCEACKTNGRCAVDDRMGEVYCLIEAADTLTCVAPVYFAGAPAQLKAVLDRLQPYFWAGVRTQEKRPARLYAIGEGNDPHGFQPLVTCVRSAFAVAGFRLDEVHDCIGLSDAELDAVAGGPCG